MAFDTWELGTDIDLLGEWANIDGENQDPDTIALDLTEPDGTVTSWVKADLTQDVVGKWYRVHTTAQVGLHTFTFTAIGSGTQVVKTGYFRVVDLTP